MHKRTTATVVAGLAVALAAPLTGSAAHAGDSRGNTSLAQVLAADGNEFDRNWMDFDIVDAAVNAVLDAKPDSTVGVLADGDVDLTAFIPTDRAFRRLVDDLTGDKPATEQETFDVVASLGIDTVEGVLLYHVVPGPAIDYRTARKADGARLETALGKKIRVNVSPNGKVVRLKDRDPDARNPIVLRKLSDINKGNPQIAHGIRDVLRPANL
ncbi:fasciclin domain-containing protein [Nocardioides coralli]|uniref:fasciclin domain-containing protein n=1 Tax=Nocardioides coralli TaxID=2872154 RepID=UPI001CA3F718|nr:fasciclin domain-containing protein [Nocardioides coralli]QZY30657.1 fasciclin domain-containing protein [Nocardioides coralli]